MGSAYRRLVTVLAVALFALGAFLDFTADTPTAKKWKPALVRAEATREMVAYDPQGTASDVGSRSNVDLKPMETYYHVLGVIQDHYVERIDESDQKALSYSSVRTMLDSLKDPYTRFYEPPQAEIIDLARQGKFYGIGAVFAVRKEKSADVSEEKLYVVSTFPGSPAEKAGLQTGDVLTHLDGKSILPYNPFQRVEKLIKTARNSDDEERMKLQKVLEAEDKRITGGITINKTVDQLSGKLNQEFTLTVSRTGVAKPVKAKMSTAETLVDPVSHATIDNGIGYVKLRLLSKAGNDEFALSMQELEEKGVKTLILDLRDSFGGSPEVAGQVASWFAPNKSLTTMLLSHNRRQTVKIPAFQAAEGTTAKPWTGKTIILVDRGTSGIAEVLASALKDAKVGQTVGETTFGQGIQQTVYKLKDGSAVSITTGRYLSPLGRDINLKGLAPDVKVTAKPTGDSDPVLARAVELAKAQ